MKQKIYIVSLGCPRNLVDSEGIAGRLKGKGISIVDDLTSADSVIINTCSFIKEAKEESIEFILDAIELKKQGKLKKVIVAGCLSERYPKELFRELKEVDAFIGRQDINSFNKKFLLTPPHYAYLKICEGCFNNCSFCVIPKIKGKFKSRDKEDIIKEVKLLDKKKISELNIIGQDITCFGLDKGHKGGLTDLVLEVLNCTSNIKWVRLLYLNPLRIGKDLIELIQSQNKICKYIDMPIQHINERILKLMNRQISKKEIISLIKRLRKEIPGVAIRTSIIVGFPTETEKEFNELIDFISEARFERLGAFVYSREEDTPAYSFSGQIPEAVKQKRFDLLMRKQQEIAAEINQVLVGAVKDVIIDEKNKDGTYTGRMAMDAPEVDGSVFVSSMDKLSLGDVIKVKITEGYEYDLMGQKTPA